jgi:hypothetical protein
MEIDEEGKAIVVAKKIINKRVKVFSPTISVIKKKMRQLINNHDKNK